jgi:RimJ/RimL family protein N-acetyltransferase
MKYNENVIDGEKIILRNIEITDCNEKYISWLNDKEVNQYLESRLTVQTIETIQKFVLNIINSEDTYMFAIINKKTNKHIGNIKIGPIHPIYKNTFIGYLIGEKECWGKGMGTEAVYLTIKFCFDILGLHKVSAGIVASNIASSKILEKMGFQREACLRDAVLLDNEQYTDVYYFGLLVNESAVLPNTEPI